MENTICGNPIGTSAMLAGHTKLNTPEINCNKMVFYQHRVTVSKVPRDSTEWQHNQATYDSSDKSVSEQHSELTYDTRGNDITEQHANHFSNTDDRSVPTKHCNPHDKLSSDKHDNPQCDPHSNPHCGDRHRKSFYDPQCDPLVKTPRDPHRDPHQKSTYQLCHGPTSVSIRVFKPMLFLLLFLLVTIPSGE